MTVVIRPFDHSQGGRDWAAHRDFLDKVYGPEGGGRRERALRWVTLENPVDLPGERRYVAADGERIVASLGRMPVRFTVSGKPFLLRYSHDLLVDPDYRGRQLALRLVGEVAARSDSPVGGLWMTGPSYAIHRKCGWKAMAPSRAQIRFLDSARLLSRRMPVILAKAVGPALQAAVGAASVDAWAARPAGYSVEEVGSFEAEADRLWSEVSPQLGVAAVRDAAYLRWRFEMAPHASYVRLVARRGNAMRGYLALRLPAREEAGGLAVAVDLLAPPDEAEAVTVLMCEAVGRARASRASALIAFTTLPSFRRRLARLGFVKAPRPQTFVLGNLQGRPDREILADAAHWYLTFTDSDGDMWTGAQPAVRV